MSEAGASDGSADISSSLTVPVPATDQAPGFAPDEPTDERERGDWKTRYDDKVAQRAIRFEAWFVWLCLVFSVLGAVAIAILGILLPDTPRQIFRTLEPYGLAFVGGILGGTLFSMKWLYHTVAKEIWNRDRRLWRVFTPFLSGGAALAVILLCSSGVLPFFGPELVRSSAGALGLSIVLGYFSDRAFSSLEQLAEDLGMRKLPKKDKPSSRRPGK